MLAMTHTTTVTTTADGFYVWRCSCGQYDVHTGMTYLVASAGARWHRKRWRDA